MEVVGQLFESLMDMGEHIDHVSPTPRATALTAAEQCVPALYCCHDGSSGLTPPPDSLYPACRLTPSALPYMDI